jgi:hypothetical protein
MSRTALREWLGNPISLAGKQLAYDVSIGLKRTVVRHYRKVFERGLAGIRKAT